MISPADAEQACQHLSRHDPVMKAVIDRVGPFRLQPPRNRFRTLVRAIVSQQISTAAAATIMRQLEQLAGGPPTAQWLLSTDPVALRGVGVSAQKARYLKDLAAKSADGTIRYRRHHRMDDATVIDELKQVVGIGTWTAQMFLIFSLGRLDVLPTDDLGVRSAVRQLYALDELPRSAELEQIAEPWRPFASVGSWYCWRSLEP